MITDPIGQFEKYTKDANDYMGQRTRSVLSQYPLLFSFLILFGSIATLKGFESVIVQIPLFAEHPSLLFVIGIVTLLFTGSLFKILQKNK